MPVCKYDRKRKNPDEVEAVSQFRGHPAVPYPACSMQQEADMEGGKSTVSLYLTWVDILVFADPLKQNFFYTQPGKN